MKLLFLPHRIPFPPNKGEKIRAFNILQFLAKRHEIHVATLADDRGDIESIPQLQSLVQSLTVQRLRPRARKVRASAGLMGQDSLTSRYFHSGALQHRIDDLIERVGIEAIFCSSSPMAEYVFRSRHAERLHSLPKTMDLIDVDSVKWAHYADRSPPWSAWLYRREARCIAALERRISSEFDHVLVVSEAERRCCGHLAEERVTVLPNGVDLEYFSPQALSPPTSAAVPTIVFTGVLDYRPNIDGVIWFADHIFPRVRARVPEVKFYVVGSRPSGSILRLGRRAGIVVTGFVPDVREYLAGAAACIAPLRIARGLQNKVLEGMAMGRPVVATPQAYEGIDAVPGRDILVADDESQYATLLVELLTDGQRAARIGRAARALVEQRYSWAAKLQQLETLVPGMARAEQHSLQQRRARQLSSHDEAAEMPRVS